MNRVVAEGLRIAGRYTLVEKLGSGGQGEVWRAVDQENPESVALKILSRTFSPGSDPWEVLQREFQVVRELKILFREWLETHYPARAAHVMSIIHSLRGGQDNDPRFGSRMRGEGPFAQLLRQRFQLACTRYGLTRGAVAPLSTALFRPPPANRGQLDLGF